MVDDWKSVGNKYLKQIKAIFKDYYLEINLDSLETFPCAGILSSCAMELDPEIIIPDTCSYYCNRSDSVDHRVLICSKLKTTLKKMTAKINESQNYDLIKFTRSSSFYIKTEDRMQTLYGDKYKNNIKKITDACEDLSILSNPRLPKFECPDGMEENDYLKQLCRDGWAKLLAEN